jgi:hypothetical protein
MGWWARPGHDRSAEFVAPDAADPPLVIDLRERLYDTTNVSDVDASTEPGVPESALSSWERRAWGDLGYELARVQENLQRVTQAAPPDVRIVISPVAPPAANPAPLAGTPVLPEATPRVERSGRPPRRGLVVSCLVALAALTALAVTLVAVLNTDEGPAQPAAAGVGSGVDATRALSSGAVTWLRDSTAVGAGIAVPPHLRLALAAALPGRDVRGYQDAKSGDLIVVADNVTVPARLVTGSVPVASFGAGVDVRQPRAPGVSWATELAARAAAGQELADNNALHFTRRAEAALRGGTMDPRLLTVLAGLSLEHRVWVDVPAVAAGSETVRLAVHVLRVDGSRISAYPWGAAIVKAFLTVQSPTFTPQEIAVVPRSSGLDALVIRYTLPSPTGLLGGAGFPTTR